MARIVVSGYMIRMPLAGNVLAFAQYLLGFERLGHLVVYIEESGWPRACYDPQSKCYGDDPSSGMQSVRRMLAAIGCTCEVAYVDTGNDRTFGIDASCIDDCIVNADLVLNLGGVCWLPAFEDASHLALVDMDPMFTQAGKFAQGRLDRYDVHFTYGTNIGQSGCTIPTGEIEWQPTFPPVVTECWQRDRATPAIPPLRFTTVANWSAYGDVEANGELYGQKDRQFLELVDLPKYTGAIIELAVSGMPKHVAERFLDAGWRLTDAASVSGTIDRYKSFIMDSSGELSVAKHGYVRSRSGWISDRTVCYLAAGKPVVVQDTGVSVALAQSGAWFAFEDLHGAVEAIDAISGNYGRAARDARQLAEEIFSYRRVLPRILERALSTSRQSSHEPR